MEDAHATILDMDKVKPYGEDDDSKTTEESSGDVPASADPSRHVAFFGVYDGHGGEKAAIFTGDYLHQLIKATPSFSQGDYVNALKDGFLSCDQAILRDFYMRDDDSGCAATSAIITDSEIVCGNAGDSRTIMSINGFAKALSYDHKPSNEGEKARICSAGGYVDMGRVNGNLALSRGIGDFEFKKNVDLPAEEQIVTCYPDVIDHKINFDTDEFVVLACDGIWDCLTSQNCVECIRRGIYERKSLPTICEEIMELCCAPTSDGSGIGCDNMSIVIVALLDFARNETLDQWYDKIIARIDSKSEKYGKISAPYNDIYKQMYGQYYDIGQQGQQAKSNGLANGSMLSRYDYDEDEDDHEKEVHEDDGAKDVTNGAISLQRLLTSNAITNENGVIYLDTSSAQSLLAHFGMSEQEEDEASHDENHDRHIEEDVEDEESDENVEGKAEETA